MMRLSEVTKLVCNFYLSVAARTVFQTDRCLMCIVDVAGKLTVFWRSKFAESPSMNQVHWSAIFRYLASYRLVGLVVRRPPRERKVPGSNPTCAGIFSGSSHTSDFKIGTPVATLPGAWRYRVSTGTGRPGVSILWLGEVERWISNFYLSVAARKIVWADPSLRYTSMLLRR